ncbi:MAG TPA: hypothetical protein VKU83_06495 [Puia sp.]|nr:hypothetical protein [Puia sp.]
MKVLISWHVIETDHIVSISPTSVDHTGWIGFDIHLAHMSKPLRAEHREQAGAASMRDQLIAIWTGHGIIQEIKASNNEKTDH